MKEEGIDREGMHEFHCQDKLDRFFGWAYEHVSIHEEDIRVAQIPWTPYRNRCHVFSWIGHSHC